MIHGVIEVASEHTYISKRRGFLHVEQREGKVADIDFDEIDSVILSARQATISRTLLAELGSRAIPVIVADEHYQPIAITVPCSTTTPSSGRIRAQVECSKPKQKRIWQQIVRTKIKHQAYVLETITDSRLVTKLHLIAKTTQSGDPTNREAYAAKLYWKELFGKAFTRNRDKPGRNAQLNYGYAILRASVARSVAAVGLALGIGIHHKNSHNPMCLVDDLMEPYRPVVDYIVAGLPTPELNPENKQILATIGVQDCAGSRGTSPLVHAIHEMVLSLADVFAGLNTQFVIPEWIPPQEDNQENAERL